MQYFGKFETKYEELFLTESYLYINKDEEDIITAKELKELINNTKLRKKILLEQFFYIIL